MYVSVGFCAEMGIHYRHVMSCEIEPFKQCYILKNFEPEVVFRDICELAGANNLGGATTVAGDIEHVPEADLVIAGIVCHDFSLLNRNPKAFGASFRAQLGISTDGYLS